MALLITETKYDDVEVLVEAPREGKPKTHYIHGIFMQGNIKNKNGRIYPSQILEKEMNRYNETHIKENRALGELDHPSGPGINTDRVCHVITEMHKDGDNFIGKAKVLDTPMGKILKSLLDEGIKTGVSTRGLGSVVPTSEGIMEVQNDFYLAAVDSVTTPSAPHAFVKGIMENTEYYYDVASGNWLVQERLEETVKAIKKDPKVTSAQAIRIFESFIKSL